MRMTADPAKDNIYPRKFAAFSEFLFTEAEFSAIILGENAKIYEVSE